MQRLHRRVTQAHVCLKPAVQELTVAIIRVGMSPAAQSNTACLRTCPSAARQAALPFGSCSRRASGAVICIVAMCLAVASRGSCRALAPEAAHQLHRLQMLWQRLCNEPVSRVSSCLASLQHAQCGYLLVQRAACLLNLRCGV